MILYLHGFRSSPDSFKSRMMAERMASLQRKEEFVCPNLSVSPRQAIEQLTDYVEGYTLLSPRTLTIIGSSLGGFYATWLAEQYGCKAVLLNPAIHPWTDLEQYVGEQPLYHGGGSIHVLPAHMAELQALAVPQITEPERYFLVAATGDEVLNYREMLAHYATAPTKLIEGSDHGLSDFADHIDEVLRFCEIDPHVPNQRVSWRVTLT